MADKGSMQFDLMYAWFAVAATAATLFTMSVRNRRSGWRRQRSDLILENLMAWSSVEEQERTESSQRKTVQENFAAHSAAHGLASDMIALHSALQSHKVETIGSQQEQETSMVGTSPKS